MSMQEIDPELSASSGLTNDVCDRLTIFTTSIVSSAIGGEGPTEDCEAMRSAQQTPSKAEIAGSESEADTPVPEEERLMYEAADCFLKSMEGASMSEMKNVIGERLYYIISEEHPQLAGKLTGMFLDATSNIKDLALLLYSPASMKLLLNEAMNVLSASLAVDESTASPQSGCISTASSNGLHPDEVPGLKRSHPPGSRNVPHSKKPKHDPTRPFFAEITDDSGRRTRVPCRYDIKSLMYVPSGGRETVPCGKKVGTRPKTPQDLQALELGESDEGKLRARQKQIDIGCKTSGYRRLMALGLSGRAVQDALGLPYMTEDGTLALTLLCSKKRYDGYLRIWKRRLYQFAGLQLLHFCPDAPAALTPVHGPAAPPSPLDSPSHTPSPPPSPAAPGSWAARVAAGMA